MDRVEQKIAAMLSDAYDEMRNHNFDAAIMWATAAVEEWSGAISPQPNNEQRYREALETALGCCQEVAHEVEDPLQACAEIEAAVQAALKEEAQKWRDVRTVLACMGEEHYSRSELEEETP